MNLVKTMQDKANSIMANRKYLQILSMLLLGIGIFLLPIYLRAPMLKGMIGVWRYVNVFALVAIVILVSMRKQLTNKEKMMIALWVFATILMICSNEKSKTYVTMTVMVQIIAPLLLLLCRLDKKYAESIIKWTLCVFNVFIIGLVLLAVFERFTGYSVLLFVADKIDSHDISVIATMAVTENRFGSIWGHALTNAFLFNAFYVLNDSYYRVKHVKYPRLLFLAVAMVGVLLTASKTAIVVLGVYFLLTNYKDKKVMITCVIGIVVVFATGLFDVVIERFASGPLTTGRMGALQTYIDSDVNPLMLWTGYGSSTAFDADMEMFKAAFEFPILMFALDYGILFSVIYIFSIYGYVSYQLIKRKQYALWIGFSGLYAELNTYNGMSIRSHDICYIMCMVSMLLINISRLERKHG